MMLAKNFALAELEASVTAAARGIENRAPAEIMPNLKRLAEWLQVLRERIGKPIIITSGYRGPALNKAVGGSPGSAHCKGLAADIQVRGMAPEEIVEFIRLRMSDHPADQVIDEDDGRAQWVHVGLAQVPRKQFLIARKAGGKMTYAVA